MEAAMHTRSTAAPRPAARWPVRGSAVLLAVGMLGHLYAAHAIGGSRVAYTHHVLGFLLILLVTGGLIAGAGRRFWRSRSALTLVLIAAAQALLGLLVARAAVGS
jgi:hypothetical protein